MKQLNDLSIPSKKPIEEEKKAPPLEGKVRDALGRPGLVLCGECRDLRKLFRSFKTWSGYKSHLQNFHYAAGKDKINVYYDEKIIDEQNKRAVEQSDLDASISTGPDGGTELAGGAVEQ